MSGGGSLTAVGLHDDSCGVGRFERIERAKGELRQLDTFHMDLYCPTDQALSCVRRPGAQNLKAYAISPRSISAKRQHVRCNGSSGSTLLD